MANDASLSSQPSSAATATSPSAARGGGLQQQQPQDCATTTLPPPPVFSIVPSRVSALSEAQRRKCLLLRRRVRLQQELLLAQSKKAAASGGGGGTMMVMGGAGSGSAAGGVCDDVAGATTKRSSNKEEDEEESKEDDALVKAAAAVSKVAALMKHEATGGAERGRVCFLDSPMTGFELNWIIDELNLARCLCARDWHVGKAFVLLMETVCFRRYAKPERIRPKEVCGADKNGQLYRRGFDLQGRPILYVRPRLSSSSDDATKALKLLVYMLERCVQSMNRRKCVHAITFVMDYNGYTTSNQPPLPVALRFLDIFQNYYYERLGLAFIVDTPWYFQTFWGLISPFLPQRTTEKIKFVNSSNAAERQQIFDAIAPNFVEDWIPGGGCSIAYDHDRYWNEDSSQFTNYMKFLQAEFIKKSQEQRMAEIRRAHSEDDKALTVQEDIRNGGRAPSGSAQTEEEEEQGAGEEREEDETTSKELAEDEEKRRKLHEALAQQEEGKKN